MRDLVDQEVQALVYVLNTDHTATVAEFDDDHEPVGPMLRKRLVPKFMRPREDSGQIVLTEEGMEIAMTRKYGRR